MTKEKSILRNRDHLFTFLIAIAKRNGGEIRLTEDEIIKVQKSDLMSLTYDVEKKELIFIVQTLDTVDGYNTTEDPKTRKDN
tara:strand:- start:1581 stop:1826 length:246 start_codon:yes stop_codon:yes gene_type:complete